MVVITTREDRYEELYTCDILHMQYFTHAVQNIPKEFKIVTSGGWNYECLLFPSSPVFCIFCILMIISIIKKYSLKSN